MGLTEQELRHFGVAAEEIWKARVLKENMISSQWKAKWNWLLDEYKAMTMQLEEIKKHRPVSKKLKAVGILGSCKPLPSTSSRVIGWLASRPEFKLEIYGPYVKNFPLLPTVFE